MDYKKIYVKICPSNWFLISNQINIIVEKRLSQK